LTRCVSGRAVRGDLNDNRLIRFDSDTTEARMTKPRRPLVLAAVLNLTVTAGVALAQTVIVMDAPAASAVELVLNAETVATATTDSLGDATLASPPGAWKAPTAASVFVDACPAVRRVLLVERGLTAPQQGTLCDRRQVDGVYWVEAISTLVLNLSGADPSLRLRQGPAPASWLSREPLGLTPDTGATLPGLVLSGAGGLGVFRDFVERACGNIAPCESDQSPRAFSAGVAYWIAPFLAAEAGYFKALDATASGAGTGFRFDSLLETQILTLAGTAGIPLGRVRLYGQAGANRHRATFTTTQTVDATTVTVDGVPTTIAGGTQTYSTRTEGWGLLFGGGLEVWFTRWLGLYGEGRRLGIKGSDIDEGEGTIDDRLISIVIGAKFRLGGS
jgi:hypothetical protein